MCACMYYDIPTRNSIDSFENQHVHKTATRTEAGARLSTDPSDLLLAPIRCHFPARLPSCTQSRQQFAGMYGVVKKREAMVQWKDV